MKIWRMTKWRFWTSNILNDVTCFTGSEDGGEAPELIANESELMQTNYQTSDS